MPYKAKSIRTFIGAKNYALSRQFYQELGFEEVVLSKDMCVFKVNEQLHFYLQDYYVKKWIENSMVFLEVDDIEVCWQVESVFYTILLAYFGILDSLRKWHSLSNFMLILLKSQAYIHTIQAHI